ncbi:MAG: DNA-binding protein WhiA [Oscillospiraceae bacterium]|jgi:DNA-binding protein WhiA|nr:DNA-binding protein WhiA [Oscillospiraceae bacterium]
MSFSSEVKNELSRIRETLKNHRKILLHGMLCGSRKAVPGIENEQVIALFNKLTGEFGTYDVNYMSGININGGDRETGLFLRGLFLTCGTVSDPGKNYHLELSVPDENKIDALFTLINEIGIAIRKSTRKSRPLLYIKESEMISDFLTFIGAGVNSMEVMNAKILKEVRNNVNRAVNCDAANIEKTTRAAGKQIADIELISERKGADFLSPELRQIAQLRLNNIEMSLKEIGEACEPRLSRSGVFHRLEKINSIAEKLRNEHQEN